MKALSVRAPWWWAILHGKPVENRDWPTRFRGRVWIHAGKWWKLSEVKEDYADVAEMAKRDGFDWPDPCFAALHQAGGCIVGSVTVVDCVTSPSLRLLCWRVWVCSCATQSSSISQSRSRECSDSSRFRMMSW